MRSHTLQVFVILFLIFLAIPCFESLFLFQEKDLFAEMDLDSCEAERPPLDTRERPLGKEEGGFPLFGLILFIILLGFQLI